MEKIKGFVFPSQFENFKEGKAGTVYVWKSGEPQWGKAMIPVTFSPTRLDEGRIGQEPFVSQDKPDYEAIVKGMEKYMHKEEYRLRTEGYAMVRGASRGEHFLRNLKAKHTPNQEGNDET